MESIIYGYDFLLSFDFFIIRFFIYIYICIDIVQISPRDSSNIIKNDFEKETFIFGICVVDRRKKGWKEKEEMEEKKLI